MKTKSGETIPTNLSAQLHKSRSILEAWEKLRPSCQRDYVARVKKAITPDAREKKIDRVLELTKSYASKHPNKYKKVK